MSTGPENEKSLSRRLGPGIILEIPPNYSGISGLFTTLADFTVIEDNRTNRWSRKGLPLLGALSFSMRPAILFRKEVRKKLMPVVFSRKFEEKFRLKID